MNEQIINSNVNIDFKPAFNKGDKSLPTRQRSSFFRPKSSSYDPAMNSEKYIAHRYEDKSVHDIHIKDGEIPLRV
jgi:hypothetical protein